MLKLVSKFTMDILPSVIATIIGAYIVNHYINVKPAADAAATAAVSSADPKKAHSRPAEKSADLGNIREPGVRAKGISEKSITEKAITERASAEKSSIDKSAADKPVEKPADKADRPAETASIPPVAPASAAADTRRHQPREKAAVRTAPAAAPAAEPVVAAPNTVPPAETANAPDANDLARAAIERLRGAPEATSRPQESRPQEPAREAVRVPEAPRFVTTAPAAPAPVVMMPPVQPLPPPILVSTPPAESPAKPSAARGDDDPLRPTPPADIPDPRPPLDLRADAVDAPAREHTNVAEDMLSAAKSMFHSVLPK